MDYSVWQPYSLVNYIPHSGTMNLATEDDRRSCEERSISNVKKMEEFHRKGMQLIYPPPPMHLPSSLIMFV